VTGPLKLIAGNSNPELAREISGHLNVPFCDTDVSRFSDGEVSVYIKETVRGADVFVIQSTSPPVNENLMELLVMIDALKRASARRICAVIPYYGYGRQDRKKMGRVPITAKLVANLIETAGADRVLTLDLHAGQIQGFFDIPVDNLRSDVIFARYFMRQGLNENDWVVVSPDVGGVKRARAVAEQLNLPIAMAEKRRAIVSVGKRADQPIEGVTVIGEVERRKAIIVDDIISTGGTLIEVAKALMESGSPAVYAVCTHGVFAGNCIEKLESSPLQKVVVTNTITGHNSPKIERISVGGLFADIIERIHSDDSVSEMFPHY
jgi:ribose-phosphate pyrophosphokinase